MKYIKLNLGITKVYLLPIKGGYILVDTGYYTDYKKFIKKMAEKKISMKQIKYLLITHYHDDHAGFAQKLKDEFKIPLIVQHESVALLAKGNSAVQEAGFPITKRVGFVFKLFSVFHKSFEYPPVVVDSNDIIVVEDNSKVLRELGLAANIVFTPGHTRDSMSILCDDGTAFVGDACMNFMLLLGANYRPIYYTDKEKMYNNIRKLISLGLKTIVPAHGKEYDVSKLHNMLRKCQGNKY